MLISIYYIQWMLWMREMLQVGIIIIIITILGGGGGGVEGAGGGSA